MWRADLAAVQVDRRAVVDGVELEDPLARRAASARRVNSVAYQAMLPVYERLGGVAGVEGVRDGDRRPGGEVLRRARSRWRRPRLAGRAFTIPRAADREAADWP